MIQEIYTYIDVHEDKSYKTSINYQIMLKANKVSTVFSEGSHKGDSIYTSAEKNSFIFDYFDAKYSK